MRKSPRSTSTLAIAVLAATAAGAAAQTILHDNGGFVTHLGEGFNGADVSQTDNNFFGIGALLTPGGGGTAYRIAEDFIVPASGWTIDRIRIYAYSTIAAGSAVPPAPFVVMDMNIWDGHPRAVGSTIVATSNTLGDSAWTGAYRTDSGNLTQSTRPIYSVEAVFNSLQLPAGTYWYDVQVTGGDATAPFVMDGLLNADGNAMNLFLDSIGFNPMRYGSPQRGLAFPFLVLGAGPQACYANCDNSTIAPILNVDDFTCFINEFASAQALPHEAQVAHYANCDGSTIAPALNVDDFTCFINEFAMGCP
jgi:hypothetical protein